jgi:outer membrane protein TolC
MEGPMLEKDNWKHWPAEAGLSAVAVAIAVVLVGTAAAQDSPVVAQQTELRDSAIPSVIFGGGVSPAPTAIAATRQWRASDAAAVDLAGVAASTERNAARSDGIPRRITLEEVKQQLVNPQANPLARLGQLSIEAARQHRIGAQADYLPKISTTVANLHFSEFLGQVLTLQRPLSGSLLQVPIPLLTQNLTVVAVTFVQPITPILQVHQLVKIARADERIAMAKAGVSIAKNVRDSQLEETYFKLLIAQRKLATAELKVGSPEIRTLYASTSIQLASATGHDPELVDAKKTILLASSEVKELTASLNRVMGWPDDTVLDLVPPDPLVENTSFQEVADQSTGANPDVVEAEQTAIKARAASVLSKLAYVPTVAATGGFIYQNAVPLLPNTFGYGGVMVSYNLFDFGKREAAVKEASAQLGMAELGVQLTKAKVAESIKKTYFELERTRQFSQLAQQMGSSVIHLVTVSATPASSELNIARAKAETEMFEADLAHRQAYARLQALLGEHR